MLSDVLPTWRISNLVQSFLIVLKTIDRTSSAQLMLYMLFFWPAKDPETCSYDQ